MAVTQQELTALLTKVARDGATRGGRGLSGLMGQEIAIHIPNVRAGTKSDACDAVGGEDAIVLGCYLGMTGEISGHVMLLFPVGRALACADLMCGQDPGTTTEVDEVAESAIGELGNIVGSAFVNALADATNLTLHPTTPTVVHDMALALVESVYAEILVQGGDIVMIDTVFEDANGTTAGLLIFAPDPASLANVMGLAA
ncbi:MAG: chemotaxis protein CheC [Dehalococcoidia bacterium]